MLDRTIKVDYKIPSKPKVSQAAVDFIDKLLQGDPQKRLTVEGVYNHPWFKTNLPKNVTPSPPLKLALPSQYCAMMLYAPNHTNSHSAGFRLVAPRSGDVK